MVTKKQVFAILRYDGFQNESTPIENRVTVTAVVNDQSTAHAEVERLNRLNGAKGVRYFWQTTRMVIGAS